MARNTLVLPLPDGPTSASSSPFAQSMRACSGIGPVWCSRACSMGMVACQPRWCRAGGMRSSQADTSRVSIDNTSSVADMVPADCMSKACTLS